MAEHMHQKDYKSLEEMWSDLLSLHWDYVDTEENMKKLEMRKTLEGEYENFLCIVQHDRKFFLTETENVLKQSIMKTDDFTAYKALIGFEAISQYASNLFRKPWRKEYRCIKMYSGYYRYEVNANLVGAEKLFEAMGYTLMADQTLVLDGPICPDQVTNVSRDAMAAYVECQIMKQIFLGLTTLQYQTTWKEIFRYREMHIGSAEQAIAGMAFAIYERNYRKQKQLENCYGSIAPTVACSNICNATANTISNHPYNNNQTVNCKHQQYTTSSNVAQPINGIHGPCNAIYANPQLCSGHGHYMANGHKINGIGNDGTYAVQHMLLPHPKSLEHYHEPTTKAVVYQQHPYLPRHSYDKPSSNAYDFNSHSYDCLDAPPSAGHANDRYALPAHVESHYAQIAPNGNVYDQMLASQYSTAYATPYNQSRNNCSCSSTDYRINSNARQATNECHNYHAVPSSLCEVHGKVYPKNNASGYGRALEPYLINFEDKPINGDRDHVDGPLRHYDASELRQVKSHYNQYDASSKTSSNDKPMKYSQRNRHAADYDDYTQNDYAAQHSEPIRPPTLKHYTRNKQLLAEYEEHLDTNDSRNSRVSDFDSFESGNNLSIEREYGGGGGGGRGSVDQSTSSKIRDGVGSYETWNYVFKNIGKNGYNKPDDCDPNDLTVQGLDLNAVPPPHDKRRSRNLDTNECVALPKQMNGPGVNRKIVDSFPTNNGINNNSTRKFVSADANGMVAMPKSMLKQTTAPNGLRENGRDLHETAANTIGRSNDIVKKSNLKLTNGGNQSTQIGSRSPAAPSTARNDSQHIDAIRNAPNEWSCKFCTFLNPIHLRICQMCFKSQDFVIDVPKASTCV